MDRLAAVLRSRWTDAAIAAVFALLVIINWAADRPLTALFYALVVALWGVCAYVQHNRRRPR